MHGMPVGRSSSLAARDASHTSPYNPSLGPRIHVQGQCVCRQTSNNPCVSTHVCAGGGAAAEHDQLLPAGGVQSEVKVAVSDRCQRARRHQPAAVPLHARVAALQCRK